MKKPIFLLLVLGLTQGAFTQTFELSAEIRPRLEYLHGFKTLMLDTLDAAAFVSQRTRLNFDYNSEKIEAYLSLQNIRTWGDVATLNSSDKNGLAIQQAWASLFLSPQFSLKLGRQEISYDDERIFGSVGWAQQARSHDALLAILNPNDKHQLEIGFALNAEAETLFEVPYRLNNYKTFQYLWYHTSFTHAGLSILALNNGMSYEENSAQKTVYNQTLGMHFTFFKNKLKGDTSFYFQGGKIGNQSLSAYNFGANFYYAVAQKFTAGLGIEYLSGTDMNTTSTKLKSFTPWYGTNHKFNGWMDYFYVGNHNNSVGLLDINATLTYRKNKFSATLNPHIFSAAAVVVDETNTKMNKALGTEWDLVMQYKWTDVVAFQAGYSQMFATKTMEVLKEGNKDNTNNWAWVMITVKPSLFKTSFEKN